MTFRHPVAKATGCFSWELHKHSLRINESGYNRRNLRGEVVWEFDLSVNGQQVNVKISNDIGKITEIER